MSTMSPSEPAHKETVSLPAEEMYSATRPHKTGVAVPAYLKRVYWWTYIHPFAVWFFDRLWLINLIVLTNYHRLRDAALAEFSNLTDKKLLQISCAYGNITPKLADRVAQDSGRLDILDVLPIQLDNVRAKIPASYPVHYHLMDATALEFADGQYDGVLLFLLLHETPMDVRLKVLSEATRMLRPGGKLVVVDFALPARWNPFRYLWAVFLSVFEPFALDMWRNKIVDMMPAAARHWQRHHKRYFGGLFQKEVYIRPEPLKIAR